ncbi:MAG: TonB-dependent receptor [Bacteroidetes bacterium]|nr:TonB-dependent receptor [Bacteroidota bacterium]
MQFTKSHITRHLLITFLLIGYSFAFYGQTAYVNGTITDDKNKPVDLANVSVIGEKSGTSSDINGKFRLVVPAGKEIVIGISYIGFADKKYPVTLQEGEERDISFQLIPISTDLPGFEVKDEKLRTESMVRLNPKDANVVSSLTGGVTDLIKTLPGVSTSSELSSQYTVRGGNFDENLVFVNDIEIYRPFLVSVGQQEGLNFVNPALTASILFSAGGFGAEYGDKLSSVLDVKYIKPEEFGGSFAVSLLGAELSFGGTAANNKFTYLVGTRYQSNSYLLNSLETKGEYKPRFMDVQSQFTYQFNDKWDVSFLGYYSNNKYKVIPSDRETDFGTIQEVLRFKVYFDGNETDGYEMLQGGLTLGYKPRKNVDLKFIVSAFTTQESETYDIQGQYWLGLVENDPGSDEYGEVVQQQGVGTYLEHARNYFLSNVYTFEHKGMISYDSRFLKWGVQYSHQYVDDELKEWIMIDSAGYSIPNPIDDPGTTDPDNPSLDLRYHVKAQNTLQTNRLAAYGSHQWNISLKNNDLLTIAGGVRINYWDYNSQFLFAPRINFSYKPYKKQNLVFRLATGVYYQPPFYREMRNMDGSLNEDIKAQQSIHFILGSDYRFQAWNRPFIFTTELYYKYLDNIIPYQIDNVRIRYYADQTARGYAAGVDFKVYGEFVKGVDSWLSLSFLKTAEDIYGDYYYDYYDADGVKTGTGPEMDPDATENVKVDPGFIPRPSDRRVNFTIFFQDYIPKLPFIKMHLRLLYGTGLPFGAPDSERYQQTLRMPDYRRVDIGFSYQFIHEGTEFGPKNPMKHFKNMSISLEVFNLLQTYNTISYIWIKDAENRQFAVPNYLTPRLLNIKLTADF